MLRNLKRFCGIITRGFHVGEMHKLMENVVFNYLRILNYQVYVGTLNGFEIDFVAEKQNEKKYIQVAYRLDSEQTISREFGNLLKIKDNYPKIVVTLDEPLTPSSYGGVKHYSLLKFLTSEI